MARLALVLAALYLAAAYMILPELWWVHERRLVASIGSFVTTTPQGIPGDPINIGLVGSRRDVIAAMDKAGWHAADSLTWRSAVEIGLSVTFDRRYADAPVSTLEYEGRPQELAFEKPVGVSPDQRHHVRFWPVETDDAEALWLGSASFDKGVGISHDTAQITHHIAPDVDAERDLIVTDLETAGLAASVATEPGIGPTQDGRNGGGDRYFTDGMVDIVTLKIE
jgi:hypothetical protein